MQNGFKKSIWLNAGVGLGAAFIFSLVILWLAFDISKRTEAVQKIRQEIATRFKAVESLASLKKDEQRAKVERVFLEQALPIQDKLINFPKDVTSLAKKFKVDLGFSFGKEVASTESSAGYIGFTMTARASFNNWLDFVESLEKSQYLISFDSFNLSGGEDDFQSVINGKVFSQ